MKLNECTKDELIYLIHKYTLLPSNFETDVLFYRQEKVMAQYLICAAESNDLLGKYVDLMKPYEGKSYSEVPDKVIQKVKRILEKRNRCIEKLDQLNAQCEKLSKRIDCLIGVKDDENE